MNTQAIFCDADLKYIHICCPMHHLNISVNGIHNCSRAVYFSKFEWSAGYKWSSNLKVKLFVQGLHFGNIWRIWLPIVILRSNTRNKRFYSSLIISEKGKEAAENKIWPLTYKIFFCSSLPSSNAFTTNQEHLKSSISVPIWYHHKNESGHQFYKCRKKFIISSSLAQLVLPFQLF